MNLPLKSRYWMDLSSPDFEQLAQSIWIDNVVAILPVAAIEQHGPHLSVGVDTFLIDSIVQASLPLLPLDLPVLILPTQTIGKSNEHSRFAGTLSLSSETLMRLWLEIGACIAKSGVKKLLLFNSHGGQVSMMDLVARDLRELHQLMVFSSSWYNLPLGDAFDAFSAQEHRFGVHAGDVETSMMLACCPNGVEMQKAEHFISAAQARAADYPILGNGRSAKLGWHIQDYHPKGAAGDATHATTQKGKALIDSAAQQLSLLLQEISRLPISALNLN